MYERIPHASLRNKSKSVPNRHSIFSNVRILCKIRKVRYFLPYEECFLKPPAAFANVKIQNLFKFRTTYSVDDSNWWSQISRCSTYFGVIQLASCLKLLETAGY